MQQPPIGIDIGTSTSAVATVNSSGEPIVLPGRNGARLTPSVICFADEVYVGSEAVEQIGSNLDNYAEAFKRDIGNSHYRKRLHSHAVPPEVLTGFLVEHLVKYARADLPPFDSAVVTVPAYFDERKRNATRQAVELAGLKTLDIINEPTAAAIAAAYKSLIAGNIRPCHKILVYDLGGGTFDATLLEVDGSVFKTLATDGEVYLGGQDFNDLIASMLANSFIMKFGIDPRNDPAAATRISATANDIKHALSRRDRVDAVFNYVGKQARLAITRDAFEEAIAPLIDRSIMTCQATLNDAGLRFADLDEILLVGGSSRVPLVKRQLEQECGCIVHTVDEPDELVARGAALYAAAITDHPYLPPNARFKVVNVNAHSLGIQGVDPQTKERVNKIMIPRNTPLPAKAAMSFSTYQPNQPNIRVRLLEGESDDPKYCTPLGQCVIQLNASLPAQSPIHVYCYYSAGGTITVTSKVPATGDEGLVVWRREGFDDFESLRAWRSRLNTSITGNSRRVDPLSLARETNLGNTSDAGAMLARLDQIYEYLGLTVLNTKSQIADPFVDAAKGFVHQTLNALRDLEGAINQLRKTAEIDDALGVSGRSDSSGPQCELSKLRISHDQMCRLHQHSRINLGRVYFAARKGQIEDAELCEEIKSLHSWLNVFPDT